MRRIRNYETPTNSSCVARQRVSEASQESVVVVAVLADGAHGAHVAAQLAPARFRRRGNHVLFDL